MFLQIKMSKNVEVPQKFNEFNKRKWVKWQISQIASSKTSILFSVARKLFEGCHIDRELERPAKILN